MEQLFQITTDIFIACPKRVATYLRQEVESLGYQIKQESVAGIYVEGTMDDCIRLNMALRCAYRVLFFIKKFRATNANELYKEIRKIEWENILLKDGYFTVESYSNNETINDTRFTSLRTKDAIADRFVELYRKRPDSGSEKNAASVYIHWDEDEVTVYIDTSGETLAKHGYRKMPHKAPMIEGLAAANIMAMQWNTETTFVNPMCGSGTLAIEAALMASHRAPGLLRDNYAFMHLVGYDKDFYVQEKSKLRKQIDDNITVKIIASDINETAVNAARHNAGEAGVQHLIDFQICDFRETEIVGSKGVVILNPEYGLRLGDEEELEAVYKAMGDFFKQKCKGFNCFIFTGNMYLAKKIGLKASRRIEFYNGTIDCRLLKFEMYDGSRRTVRIEE